MPTCRNLHGRQFQLAVVCLLTLATASASADEPLPSARKPPITALAFVPDGTALVVGSQAGVELRAWPDLTVVRELPTQFRHVHDLAFSPDGRRLALAGGEPAVSGSVELLAWPSCELGYHVEPHTDVVYDIAWQNDGSTWAAASLDRVAVHCRAEDGAVLRRIEGHARGVLAVCFVEEGKLLVTAGLDNSLRVWDLGSGELVRTLDNHTGPVHALALRPGQSVGALPVIASASEDRSVRLWQPTIGRMLRFARFDSAIPQAICWTPEGTRLLAVCSDGRLRVIDPDSVQVMETINALTGRAYAVAMHPTKSEAAVAGSDGQVVRRVPAAER